MDEKTQSTNPESADQIIVPLPIDNEETEDEETPKQPSLPTTDNGHNAIEAYIAPPPLPIKADDPSPPPPPPPVHSPRSPLKFAASHLRAPPPLTPMSAIDQNGAVIYNHHNNHNLPPPLPPLPLPLALPLQSAYDPHDYNISYDPPPFAIEYKCKPCDIVYNTKHELLGHKRNIHGITNGINIGRPQMMQSQQDSMMGRRARFYCNICNRNFSAKQHFEYHMRTHSGEKPFKCPTCGKAFRAKHSLKNHIRIHTGERPYQCKVCGKWFRQLGVMKNHIKNMHSRT